MKNDIKTSLQKKVFDSLKDEHRIILRWATGVGKSKMAIDLVNNAVSNIRKAHNRRLKIAFIVAERSHISNWEKEFSTWGLNKDGVDISILCYASLHKLKDSSVDILILDEAHHCFTDKRKAILESITTDYVYMLSATLSRQKIEEIEDIFGKFTYSTVSLKDAINIDLLPDPNVYVIEMHLDDTVANQTILIGKDKHAPKVPWEHRYRYLYRNAPCCIQCTAKQKYQFLTEKMDYWKRRYESSHNQFHHSLWVNTGSQRKRFLGELKTYYVKLLTSSLATTRFICFCASVAQAETLDRRHTISSRKPSKSNQAIIDAFNNKDLNRIYAVGMANEGLNLVDIQAGIIAQLDGKERLFIQKFGRSMRAEDPVAYIFYYKDTQDEVYLKHALENIDERFIKFTNIGQLTKVQ